MLTAAQPLVDEHAALEAQLADPAVLGDQALTERQKQSLLDVYQSFLAQNQHAQNQQTANATRAEDHAPEASNYTPDA